MRQVTSELRREAVKSLPPDKYNIMTTETVYAQGGAVLRNPTREEYASGASVEIAAVPANGYAFAGWSGAVADTANPITVTVYDNMMLMANFKYTDQNAAVKGRRLVTTVSPEDGGFIARHPDAKWYADKERVVVTATAARGYKFVEWTDAKPGDEEYGVIVTKKRDLAVTMDGDKTLSAKFKRVLFDIYFAPKYQFPPGTQVPWGGSNMEFGWIWGNGAFFGFDLNFGASTEEDVTFGAGLNLGNVYDCGNRLQLVYGGTVGAWGAQEGENLNFNFLGHFAKLRWYFIEFTYRGLWGTEVWNHGGFALRNHQLMLGLYLATSKRKR